VVREKKTALVTGASAGLGTEFARQLAAKGYDLVLVARRRDRLEILARELSDHYKVQCWIETFDLSDPVAPQALFSALQARDLAVDYLVNNAGIAGPDLLDEPDWKKHQAFYQLMMTSVAHLCHLFIPTMQDCGFGRIINVASVAGRIPRADGCNYSSSKAYVVALSESLALTLSGSGVHVTALCPGFTHTEFHESAGMIEMKNSLPRWLWYSAETVVADGIRAVEKAKPVYISGRIYRWVDPLFQSVWTRRLFKAPGR